MTKRVPEITPEEKALLERIVAEGSPDDIFPTDAEIAGARSFEEAEPDLAASILRDHPELAVPMRERTEAVRGKRGRPRLASPRQQVSIRLDADVLAKLKATGPGWQARVNDILRKAVG